MFESSICSCRRFALKCAGEEATQYWMSTPLKKRQRSSVGSLLRSWLHSTNA